jgi:UDP-2,4-diacetamido-2,4,6-trideoxy-beta-L-altropyranose hydrolase
MMPISIRITCHSTLSIWRAPFLLTASACSARATCCVCLRRHTRRGWPRRKLTEFFVFLGGSDVEGPTLPVYELLSRVSMDMQIDVVLGAAMHNRKNVAQGLTRLGPHICVLEPLAELGPFLRAHDIAVVAGGSTIWELFAAGVPILSLVVADNQLETNSHLHADDLLELVDMRLSSRGTELPQKFARLAHNSELRRMRSRKGLQLFDDKGLDRVSSLLYECNNVNSEPGPVV